MSEDQQKNTETDQAKRRFRHLWLVLVGVVVLAIICCLAWNAGWWDFRSVDEKLAAIDTELAIADSENAAIYYTRFFTDPDNATILDDLFIHTPSAYADPWADSENPELAAELKTHQAFTQKLLEISQMPKARFPVVYVDPSTDSALRLADLREVTFVLSWAAANDLAEGRIDAAHTKYQCQMQLARHLKQQPTSPYRILGISIEHVALGNIRRAVMRAEITPEQLRSLEMILEAPDKQDAKHAEIAARVDRLIRQKERSQLPPTALVLEERHNQWVFVQKERSQLPPAERFKQWRLARASGKQREQRQRLFRLRVEATRRATPILIALRRYKEETGVWPETLEQIGPKLSEEILTDPQNDGLFVYKREGDSFIFYSKGPNGVDEHGSYSRPADDWPIWPMKINKVPTASAEKQQE